MGYPRHLAKPPIVEAVMDLKFAGVDASLDELQEVLADRFEAGWTRQLTHTYAASFSPSIAAIAKTSSQLEAIAAVSPDEDQALAVRQDRLSASRIRSYTRWEDLWALLEGDFDDYVRIGKPSSVSRISARFINRLRSADSLGSYDQVLERPPLPVLRDGLEGARIANFLRRHVVEGLNGGFTANLTIGTVTPEPGEEAKSLGPMILDIDVFKVCSLPLEVSTLVAEFNQIRDLKNALFFGSLTDRMLEQFE
jgi:uncharacterized protein (TIGR04255 family)